MDVEIKEYSQKIINFLNYFETKGYKDKTDKNYERAIKLEQMAKIYHSDIIDVRKVDLMRQIYKSSDAFLKQYNDLEKCYEDKKIKKYVDLIREIGNYYRKFEQNGIKEISARLLKMEQEGYFEDYNYACYFVEEYINYNASPFLNHFLSDIGLSEAEFNRFLDIVFELNADLYDRYLEKSKANVQERKYETIKKVKNLHKGITTGIMEDGKPFDIIEFFKNIPFYDMLSAEETGRDFSISYRNASTIDHKLKAFFDSYDSKMTSAILNYMYANKINLNNPKYLSKNDIEKTSYTINGRELSQEENLLLANYMKQERIPYLFKAFSSVMDKYTRNELVIDKDKLKQKGGFSNGRL